MKNETTALRLLEAMKDMQITQRELAEKADIKEASVSQYANGSHAPSNLSAGKMAKVLHVNPVWLMGYDVPKYTREERIDTDVLDDEHFRMLLSYYQYLLKEMNK